MTKLPAYLFFCILLLNGCTIEKRRYSSGYHTTWNVHHLFPKGNGANEFHREESKLSFSPKPDSKNESAFLPIYSDSTKNQESENQAALSVASKKKTQRLASSVSDTVPETMKNESLSISISPQDSLVAKNYLDQVKQYNKSKLGSFISFAIGTIGLYIILDADVIAAYFAFFFGYLSAIIFGIIALGFFIHKKITYSQLHRDLMEKMSAANEENRNNNLLYQLKRIELAHKIKINNVKTIALGILALLTGIVDLFEIGALGYLIWPIPTLFFGVSLLFFFILRLQKSLLKKNEMTTT